MGDTTEPRPDEDRFRWQTLFQRTSEPLFLLNRRRRLLFANRAWEELTGLALSQVRRWTCKRTPQAEPGSWEAVATALSPPADALQGHSTRVRRLFVAGDLSRRWWDIEFLPLRDDKGALAILGKITPAALLSSPRVVALPEKLVALRASVAQRYRFDALPTVVPAWQRVVEQVRLAAQTTAPVLLCGEPGTGKHWLARTIHHQSGAHDKTFVAVACASLPAHVLTALLFGPGGCWQRASVGTVYLREVARLPRELQSQLADRLGEAGRPGPRVVASGRLSAEAEIAAGRLVPELYFALATLTVQVLPLRERRADLPGLVARLLERANQEPGPRVVGLTPAAWEVVQGYPWPGNLRELYEVLLAARGRAARDHLDLGELPGFVRRAVLLDQTAGREAPRALPLEEILNKVERRLILLALRTTGGNKKRAAELLSIWRTSLLGRMKRLGITDAPPDQGPAVP